MLKKLDVFVKAYQTYKGDDDWHVLRICVLIVVAAVIATFATNLADSALPAMALAVSVLAGFTFTALFSSGWLSTTDLPKPRNESDRLDERTLEKILENFRARARLFLMVSVLSLALILLISIPVRWDRVEDVLNYFVGDVRSAKIDFAYIRCVHLFMSSVMVFFTFAIFGEMLHLFYRLSESVFSALEIRNKYLAARRNKQST